MSQNSSDSIIALGCALHYLQDAYEPHHSSNVIANPINNSHKEFELYAYNNIDSLISCSAEHNKTAMAAYSSASIGELVDFVANISHLYIDYVNDENDQSNWYDVADVCIDGATSFSTIVLYKIFKEKGFI